MKIKYVINHRNSENTLAVLVSFVLSLAFLFKSPIHPWIGNAAYTDSSVFKTIALMMSTGHMPYRDSFDHKGPILYILNYIGNCISYYRGIWIIELLFMTVSVYMMYRIARLFCGKSSSVIITLLSFSLMFSYYEGGNLVEEYALPFISTSIFLFLDYIRNDHLSRTRIVLVGVCLGIVLMLRPNMIAIWVVFCLYVVINLFTKKKYREIIEYAVVFTVGISIVILPIFVWLAANSSLSYFWRDYIVFNRQYSSPEGGKALFPFQWEVCFTFTSTTVYIISFFSLLFFTISNRHNATSISQSRVMGNVFYLLYMVIDVVSLGLSGVYYPHYGMVLVPAMVYPLSMLFEIIESIKDQTIKKAILMIITLFSLSAIIMPNWFNLIKTVPTIYKQRDEYGYYNDEVLCNVVDCINENTTPEQKISVYGNYDIVYVLTKRAHATRYSYQIPIGEIMPDLFDEYFAQLQNELPEVIVIQENRHDERIHVFLDNNNYEMIWCENPEDYQSMAVYILSNEA